MTSNMLALMLTSSSSARPGCAVGIDRRAARADGQRSEQSEMSNSIENTSRCRVIVTLPEAEAKPRKVTRAVDVELEAGLDGDLAAVGLGQHLLRQPADIDLERGAGIEGQADVAAETGLQADVDR
jgi:hypothetical protein